MKRALALVLSFVFKKEKGPLIVTLLVKKSILTEKRFKSGPEKGPPTG